MSNPPKSLSPSSKIRQKSKTFQIYLEQVCALHEPISPESLSKTTSLKRKASYDIDDETPILRPFNFSSPALNVNFFNNSMI